MFYLLLFELNCIKNNMQENLTIKSLRIYKFL